jgi:hypothetical protein
LSKFWKSFKYSSKFWVDCVKWRLIKIVYILKSLLVLKVTRFKTQSDSSSGESDEPGAFVLNSCLFSLCLGLSFWLKCMLNVLKVFVDSCKECLFWFDFWKESIWKFLKVIWIRFGWLLWKFVVWRNPYADFILEICIGVFTNLNFILFDHLSFDIFQKC